MTPDINDDVLRIVNWQRVELAEMVTQATAAEIAGGMRQSDALDATVIALMSVAVNIATANSLKRATSPRQALHVLVDTLFDHVAKP